MGGGRWEVAGGKSEDRRKSLEIESIDRCRSNRFGHGMKSLAFLVEYDPALPNLYAFHLAIPAAILCVCTFTRDLP